jgi:hypothetical protein
MPLDKRRIKKAILPFLGMAFLIYITFSEIIPEGISFVEDIVFLSFIILFFYYYKADLEEMGFKLTIFGYFKRSFEILRDNPVVVVPAIFPMIVEAVSFILLFGIGVLAILGAFFFVKTEETVDIIGGALLVIFSLLWIIAAMSSVLMAQAMAVSMSREADETGKTKLQTGIQSVRGQFRELIIPSVLVALILGLESVLLIISVILGWPFTFSLILIILSTVPVTMGIFYLMFVIPPIVLQNLPFVEAARKSIAVVKGNRLDATIIFSLYVSSFIIFGVISLATFDILSLVTSLAGILIQVFLFGFTTVLITLWYKEKIANITKK